jgi:hypothetical protein
LAIASSTLNSNQVNGSLTGGISSHGTVTLKSTILSYNQNANCSAAGTFVSDGYNLESANTCGLAATGDVTNTNPYLRPLDDYGGRTPTHGLLGISPAIDAGSCAGVNGDQRGHPRVIDIAGVANADDGCDVGAYEYGWALYLPLSLRDV